MDYTKAQLKAWRNAHAAFAAAKDAMRIALDPETENYKFGMNAWKHVSRNCFRKALVHLAEAKGEVR